MGKEGGPGLVERREQVPAERAIERLSGAVLLVYGHRKAYRDLSEPMLSSHEHLFPEPNCAGDLARA